MKLPESITVGPHVYKVLFPYHFQERVDYCGQSDHSMYEIRITDVDPGGNRRPDHSILQIFLHEVIHCIDETYFYRSLFKDGDRERCVDVIANGLTQVFATLQREVKLDG